MGKNDEKKLKKANVQNYIYKGIPLHKQLSFNIQYQCFFLNDISYDF
jgi:hypothetical protein